MLRLASRVAAANSSQIWLLLSPSVGDQKLKEGIMRDFVDEFREDLAQALILVADNVALHYCDQTKQEWSAKDDFPCQMPFHEPLFIEWIMPDYMRNSAGVAVPQDIVHCGVLLRVHKASMGRWHSISLPNRGPLPSDPVPEEAEWVVDVRYVTYIPDDDVLSMPVARYEYFLDKDGNYVYGGGLMYPGEASKEQTDEMYDTYVHLMRDVYMLALSFANCKNIVKSESKELAPKAKWTRRMKVPEFRYHVLSINYSGKKRTTIGPTAGDGPGKALHIVRGNFATYTADKPLFGRVVGRVWRPAHASGSEKFGTVDKDYKLPKTEWPNGE